MAQKSRKERAKKNVTTLNNLHIGTLSINSLFLIFYFLFRSRSLLAYSAFSVPCLVAESILEITGRPKFDPITKALRNSGEDLSAPGLTDFMFDIIWMTWLSLLCVIIFGDWGWLLWITIPAYGIYKGVKLLGAASSLIRSQM